MIIAFPTYMYVSQFFDGKSDPFALALGRAFDIASAEYSFFVAIGEGDPAEKALDVFESEFIRAYGSRTEAKKARELGAELLKAYRRAGLLKYMRPRTRTIVINDRVAVFAQPDLAGGGYFIELKTFDIDPNNIPLYVKKQLEVFQLAFPGYRPVIHAFEWRSGTITHRRIEPDIKPDERLLTELYEFGVNYAQVKLDASCFIDEARSYVRNTFEIFQHGCGGLIFYAH